MAVTVEVKVYPIKGFDTRILTLCITSRLSLATHTGAALPVAAFPNPFSSHVRFQVATLGVQPLTIWDYLGRVVDITSSQPDGTVRWQPADGLPIGLYLARTTGGNQTVRLLHSGASRLPLSAIATAWRCP